VGLGFSPENRYHPRRGSLNAAVRPKKTKFGGMSFENKNTADRVRTLCARVLVAEDPDEIDDILRRLRAELRDHVGNVRRKQLGKSA